jgi:hypothetical protein
MKIVLHLVVGLSAFVVTAGVRGPYTGCCGTQVAAPAPRAVYALVEHVRARAHRVTDGR